MYVGVYVSAHEYGGQRTTSWSWFSPSTMCWSPILVGTEPSHWPKNIFISEHKRYLSKDYGLWLADKLHSQAQEQMSRYDHFPEVTMERTKANMIRWVTLPQRWVWAQWQHHERTARALHCRALWPIRRLAGHRLPVSSTPSMAPQAFFFLKEVSLWKAHILGLLSNDNI